MEKFRSVKITIYTLSLLILVGCTVPFVSNPPLKWETHVGTPSDTWVDASVAIGNEMVYVPAGEPQPEGYPCSSSYYLQAFDADNGSFIWHHQLPGCGIVNPVFSDNTVYVASSHWAIQALDAVTGQTIWTFPPIEDVVLQPPACYPHLYDPGDLVVDDETVYTVSNLTNFDLMQAGQRDSGISLLAINSRSGELEWEFLVPVMRDNYAYGPPAITEEVVSFFDRDTHIHTVNRETGLEMWSVGDEIEILSLPVAKGNSIYFIGFDDNYVLHIFMFDSKTGVEQRRIPVEVDEGSIYSGSLEIIEDTAYVLVGISVKRYPPKGYLYALDINTGQEKWRFNSDDVNGPFAYDDDTIYFSTTTALQAVDPMTGQQKWKFKTRDELYSSPVLADGIIYVGDRGGDLYAIPVPVDTQNGD